MIKLLITLSIIILVLGCVTVRISPKIPPGCTLKTTQDGMTVLCPDVSPTEAPTN